MMLDDIKPYLNPAFLDCGAYTVATGVWKELPLEDYINFACENHEHFELIALPDVVGDPAKTKEQSLEFARRTLGKIPREKLVPIYHIITGNIKYYLEMLQYAEEIGTKWVAIGSGVSGDYTALQRQIVFQEIFRNLDRSKFKIHLLGVSTPATIFQFKPDSVDSASFIIQGSNLSILKYTDDLKLHKVIKLQENTSDEIFDLSIKEIWVNRHLLETKFSSIEEMKDKLRAIPDAVRCVIANGLHIVEFERRIRESFNPSFRFRLTCTLSYLQTYQGTAGDILKTVFRDRALVAYPEYHGKSSSQNARNLNIFGKIG